MFSVWYVYRIGRDAMKELLLNMSIFIEAESSCYIQLSGESRLWHRNLSCDLNFRFVVINQLLDMPFFS